MPKMLRKELADLRAEADARHAQWDAERQAIKRVQELRGQLEQVRRDAEEAERNYDLNRAAELRYGQITELERKLRAAEEQLKSKQGDKPLLREVVTEDEIAEIVAAWTGIPVARLQEGEREKLLRLDEILHERVIGQDEAVQLVADAVIRARSRLRSAAVPVTRFGRRSTSIRWLSVPPVTIASPCWTSVSASTLALSTTAFW